MEGGVLSLTLLVLAPRGTRLAGWEPDTPQGPSLGLGAPWCPKQEP